MKVLVIETIDHKKLITNPSTQEEFLWEEQDIWIKVLEEPIRYQKLKAEPNLNLKPGQVKNIKIVNGVLTEAQESGFGNKNPPTQLVRPLGLL